MGVSFETSCVWGSWKGQSGVADDPVQFFFSREILGEIACRLSGEYERGSPFPHVVIDEIVPDSVLECVLNEIPQAGTDEFASRMDPTEHKFSLADVEQMGPVTRHLLSEFNGAPFLEFVSTLTGIDGLVPDPYFFGGGIHLIERGGYLKVHADFSLHPKLHIDRRLNAIIYLNKNWGLTYGGNLELWDESMERCVRSIEPVFGRLVLFRTTGASYHGHPDPLNTPAGVSRRSLALYYYTGQSADLERRYSTAFQRRPGESVRRTAHQVAYRWLPPVVVEAVKKRRKTSG